MALDFYQCAIPEQRQILGLPLRPLSMGHIILLNRIKSAFIVEGQPQTYEEVAIAALICSLPYQDGIKAITDPNAPKFFDYLGKRITGIGTWPVRLGLRRPRVIDLPAVCRAFGDYIKDHTRIPYYSFTDGDFADIAAPAVQLVKVALMRDMHFTEAELMDRSWQLCLWDHVTLKAMRGEVRMMEEEQVNAAKETAKAIAELIKAGKFNRGGLN